MTQVAEPRKAGPEMVEVLCDGIAIPTGFAMTPDGFEPGFVQFEPKIASKMARHYADYLISLDPTRFKIATKPAEKKPEASATGTTTPTPKGKAKK